MIAPIRTRPASCGNRPIKNYALENDVNLF
uniref:Uncharacterized protein n=1 Tax=Siphoviridae sp. ctw757 TaxID=2827969 RepID=A0A8S5TCY9_9CAUD|nr:MAG TPA: hypothetical protein [Siphoviridae sp. ctw757]